MHVQYGCNEYHLRGLRRPFYRLPLRRCEHDPGHCGRPPGRVPVGLRRYVGTVMVLADDGPHAYTNLSTGDIHVFGDCAMDTWVHEASHTFDYSAGNSPPSSSAGWEKAILDDYCVPDDYSETNRVEDFAQMSVVKVYMLLHNGYLPPGLTSDCMSHQLDYMGSLSLYNTTSLFGNTCRIENGGKVQRARFASFSSSIRSSLILRTVTI
ncbi:hypothetical protein B0H10DRAFT_2287657 [Mycena sp. CBHHK59/15]|nr:hypothetical protein B0H10DRAFT_2287657 [Mycena sp. CBHHK59/15]